MPVSRTATRDPGSPWAPRGGQVIPGADRVDAAQRLALGGRKARIAEAAAGEEVPLPAHPAAGGPRLPGLGAGVVGDRRRRWRCSWAPRRRRAGSPRRAAAARRTPIPPGKSTVRPKRLAFELDHHLARREGGAIRRPGSGRPGGGGGRQQRRSGAQQRRGERHRGSGCLESWLLHLFEDRLDETNPFNTLFAAKLSRAPADK